jgi:hypothetical protein
MHTQRRYPWFNVCWTILALSWGMPLAGTYAQNGTAKTAPNTAADEGGGTCDGCLDEAAIQSDGSANRDFFTGSKANDRDADDAIPTPSAAVFSLAMLAIGTAAFFLRRWFAM